MLRGDAGGGALRVAIVGLGPKGLFALERLLHHAHACDAAPRLRIDVFEPHPAAGAGPVYDPHEPGYLRMNLAADRLDLWPAGSRAVPGADQCSFVDWRRANGGGDASYPPRALVGRYLADGLARLLRGAPPSTTVAVRPLAVRAARRVGSAWELAAVGGSAGCYDEVLVAVGHRTSGDLWPGTRWEHAAPLIPAVFPVASRLSRSAVAPAAMVAMRGFALTFLDAALALTEGRGGTFERGEHPYRLRYLASSDDALVLAFSRSGRPMLAKPDPQLAAGVPALAEILASARARILALGEGFGLEHDLVDVLATTASACELAANGEARRGERLRRETGEAARWLHCAVQGAPPPGAGRGPAAELERSLAVATGLHRPDLQWALGHTWRGVYPALVTRFGDGRLPDCAWPVFRRLAAQMERVSFGPPPVNAAKLLALVDAGAVDLAHVSGARLVTRDGGTSIRSSGGERAIDVVVNAVLPGPGASTPDGALLDQLRANGHARVAGARRGLEVGADGGCIGAGGAHTPGLSAIGRPTEDWVIGNDTLDRTLHPQADRWARRIVRRATVAAAREAA